MVKALKLTVLNDNEPNPPLMNEWGWSVYVESEAWSLLYDADTRPEVIENNAKALGVELAALDAGFLSHYHLDHYGGYSYIGEVRRGLNVFAPRESERLRGWGLNVVEVREPREVLPGAVTTGVMSGMGVEEHSLIIGLEGHGAVVIVGCSHPGIDRIVRKAHELAGKIYLVIGGFHEPSLRQVDEVAALSEHICAAHCSGEGAKSYILRRYPEKACRVKTGTRLTLPF